MEMLVSGRDRTGRCHVGELAVQNARACRRHGCHSRHARGRDHVFAADLARCIDQRGNMLHRASHAAARFEQLLRDAHRSSGCHAAASDLLDVGLRQRREGDAT